ncbi:GAF domain-containing protein [Actinoplanes awajinensis]|uniref:Histidine kinase n=1 Tax=Actinoplanes awajinensis subsp. mycoplanecinus TaxID=135947 RepID=A0A0X3UTC9_9ACTN|nr:GAF domain-containing protein [Actinoplanes awajinensis]KUL35839.1 histidine kinase [Actinoplanes awajinensis subsp. mycoplanecinus]
MPDYPQLYERDRLREVARLGLDRGEQRAYLTGVVERVSTRLGTPFAMVDALLDDAQVFLAGCGPVPDWIAEADGTPIEWAFCTPFLTEQAARAVADFTIHPEHRDNPLVTLEGMRSYIGAPLVSSGGHVVGALCALDLRRRQFTDLDLEYLTRMAHETVRRIEEHADPAP